MTDIDITGHGGSVERPPPGDRRCRSAPGATFDAGAFDEQSVMRKQPRKPLKWVGSAKGDLDAMPDDVKDAFGHAIDLAQAGGKHRDAKALSGQGAP